MPAPPEPNISYLMEYPIKVENEKPYRNTRNPTIIIKNSGPISAVSLSVIIDIYVYNIKENKIVELIKTGFKSFDHAISVKEFEPFSDKVHSTIGINSKDLIAVYSVSASYYRKSDMKFFKKDEYFFTHNMTIYNDFEFRKDDKYQKIIDKIKSFTPPNSKDNIVKITAVAEHSLFLESGPSIFRRKNDDGSVTILTPGNQSESPINGLPHLLVTPNRFKKSNKFIDAEIEGDHINVKVKYEIKNIGDITAIITEDGFNTTVEIEPGQKKNYINNLKIYRGPDNSKPLQEFIESLDAEKEFFKSTLHILYRSKKDEKKLFKLITNNELGKNSFK